MPSLVALNVNHENFCKDIEILDNTPSRTCDTCHVFYVKDGQKDFKDILNNVVNILIVFYKFRSIQTVSGGNSKEYLLIFIKGAVAQKRKNHYKY